MYACLRFIVHFNAEYDKNERKFSIFYHILIYYDAYSYLYVYPHNKSDIFFFNFHVQDRTHIRSQFSY